MALTPSGPLERAAEVARTQPSEDWPSVSDAVKRRVRATMLPSRPVAVVAADGTTGQDEHGSRTYVSSRVVRARVRRLLTSRPDMTAERIDLTVDDDDRLVGIEVDLVCAYGTVLPVVADDARVEIAEALSELLGVGTVPRVDVSVTDVVLGDPRLT